MRVARYSSRTRTSSARRLYGGIFAVSIRPLLINLLVRELLRYAVHKGWELFMAYATTRAPTMLSEAKTTLIQLYFACRESVPPSAGHDSFAQDMWVVFGTHHSLFSPVEHRIEAPPI